MRVRWVNRLQGVTGWRAAQWDCDWAETEAALGTPLPSDYKELCARFGPGRFANYLVVLPDRWPERESLLGWWRTEAALFKDDRAGMDMMFGPYGLYGVNEPRGVIRWAYLQPTGCLFWLADADEDPDSWPVLAKIDMNYEEDWYKYEMPASEFVYRALTDQEVSPFSVEEWDPGAPRTFERLDAPE